MAVSIVLICVYFVGVVNQIHKVPTYVECATKY